jgi:hypothetical protein
MPAIHALNRCISKKPKRVAAGKALPYAQGPSAAEPVPDTVVARDYPTVVSVGPYFKPDSFDATFFTGLDLLLDGIEIAHRGQAKSPD